MKKDELQKAVGGACTIARQALKSTAPSGVAGARYDPAFRDVAILAAAIISKADIKITSEELAESINQFE